jgi:hypothetical protein
LSLRPKREEREERPPRREERPPRREREPRGDRTAEGSLRTGAFDALSDLDLEEK